MSTTLVKVEQMCYYYSVLSKITLWIIHYVRINQDPVFCRFASGI